MWNIECRGQIEIRFIEFTYFSDLLHVFFSLVYAWIIVVNCHEELQLFAQIIGRLGFTINRIFNYLINGSIFRSNIKPNCT